MLLLDDFIAARRQRDHIVIDVKVRPRLFSDFGLDFRNSPLIEVFAQNLGLSLLTWVKERHKRGSDAIARYKPHDHVCRGLMIVGKLPLVCAVSVYDLISHLLNTFFNNFLI